MKAKPWNTIMIAPAPSLISCRHCGATAGPKRELSVTGFMRLLRGFERDHNKCAPAARAADASDYAGSVIEKAKRG